MMLTSPVWLLLSGLGLLVLLLHMQRRRSIAVPSILIWQRLASPVRPRSSLRLPPLSLLLLLQLAVVLLVAAALARPLLGGTSLPGHRILVIDASGSMRATDLEPSRFVAAIARAEEMLRAIPPSPGSRVSVLTAAGEPRLLAARFDGNRGIATLLDQQRPTDGTADWRATADLIRATLVDGESAEVTVLSDDEVGAGALGVIEGTPIRIVSIWGQQPTPNAGLTARLQQLDPARGSWRVEGTVLFSGETRAATVRALFQPEGSEGFLDWASREVTAAEDATRAAFRLDLDLPGAGILALTLPDDAAPHDNVWRFVLREAPRKAAVLHLGAANAALNRALLASGAVDLFEADALPADDGRFDLVVVDGVVVDRHPATNTLFLGAGRVASEPTPTGIADPVPSHWLSGHALSHSVEWSALETAVGYRVTPLPGAEIVVEAAGAPLVQARTTAEGREVRVPLELRDAAWGEEAGFPVFVGNLLRWLNLGLDGGVVEPSCEAGRRCAIDPRFALGSVVGPNGMRQSLWPGLDRPAVLPARYEASFVPDLAGLYRLEAGSRTAVLAVNAAEAEIGTPGVSSASMPEDPVPPSPLRWWLLAAMLVVLLIEAWIAGRGAERFLQPAALAGTSPFHGRRRLLLGLRAGAVILAVAALLDLPLPILPAGEEVVAVIEPSDAALVEQLEAEAGKVGVVTLASVPSALSDVGVEFRAAAEPVAGAAVEEALALASAMLPGDRPGRVVLASSGAETRGDLFSALPSLRGRANAVDVIGSERAADTLVVSSIEAPSPVFAGDTFPITGLVFSRADTAAVFRLTRDGAILAEQEVALLGGWNRLETTIHDAPGGEALFELAVVAVGDATPENNVNGVWLDIIAEPRVAVVTPEPEAGARLVEALGVQGLEASVVRPSEAPWTLGGWLGYDAIVLANMPAIDLGTAQMEEIEAAVRDHGRGLVILGGENSFGPGGYYQTPLERLSPLSSRVPRDAPKVALSFVLDRSGSMQQEVDGVSRLDIAKQATMSAVELLQRESEISIVVFDSEARVLIPQRMNDDLEVLAGALGQLDTGGGTSIYPGMAAALEELRGSDAAARHMVVMTDGLSEPADFRTLLNQIVAEDITVSTVAIGEGADGVLLDALARLGGGAFHQTQDFAALPSILSLEAMLLSGAPTEEHQAVPRWQDQSRPFLAGLPEALPAVGGFVLTTAKPAAQLHLTVTDTEGEEMPLFASWRYGSGQVAAFTSHGVGAWTADWVATSEFPLFWGQVVRHFLPESERDGTALDVVRRGDEVDVTVTVGDGGGGVRTGLALEASISSRDSAEARIEPTPLREVAPGRYAATLAAAAPGDYTIGVEGDRVAVERSLHVAYAAILDFTAADPTRLAALAEMTGGRVFADGVWQPSDRRSGWAMHPGWPAFTMLALLLFLADLVIRYGSGLFRRRQRLVPAAT
jgi:Mg-chelatase subunit ChlD